MVGTRIVLIIVQNKHHNYTFVIYIHTGVVIYGDYHPSASDLFLFQSVSCRGDESSLEQCSITFFNKRYSCGMYNLAAVKCICELYYQNYCDYNYQIRSSLL